MTTIQKNWLKEFLKYGGIIATIAGTVFWGVLDLEDRLDAHIEKSVTAAIENYLNKTVLKMNETSNDVAVLKIGIKRVDDYMLANNYRLHYHERVMRDVAGYIHALPPHDFIKPEELRFEDFYDKENK